eukprot:39607-Chlamydomonas_euryale.AAC.7
MPRGAAACLPVCLPACPNQAPAVAPPQLKLLVCIVRKGVSPGHHSDLVAAHIPEHARMCMA